MKHALFAIGTLTGLLSAHCLAQTDVFDDGNDTGWTRFNPIGTASYSVNQGSYQVSTVSSPNVGLFGPARGGSLRLDTTYTKFCVSVDIVDWSKLPSASLGLLARVQPGAGPGTLSGYAVTFNTNDNDIGIQRITGEAPTNLGGYDGFPPAPGHDYRLVFSGVGSRLEASIYDLTDLSTPLASVAADDATYARGNSGLLIFSDTDSAITGRFDNYSAAESQPVPLDDFNDGNDTGWTQVNPVGVGTYTFPNGEYRISAAPTPTPLTMGPARAGALRNSPTLTNFCVGMDLVTFNPAEDAYIGLIARVTNPGPGTLNGYALTYQTQDFKMEINRVTGEAPTGISLVIPVVTLDPAKRYRMVFAGRGAALEGRIYDYANMAAPIATVNAFDANWTSGLCGSLVLSDSNSNASATYDSFSADDGTAPPINITQYPSGLVKVWWLHEAALCHQIEDSSTLLNWVDFVGNPQLMGKIMSQSEMPLGSHFFRLAARPKP